jgi:hypothetical protein
VPNAKNVRDMLEHFDKYVAGIGNMQTARKKADLPVSPWLVSYGSDEPVGGERRIHVDGLELDVAAAASAARPLAQAALQAASISAVSGSDSGGEGE